ncbi:hypothetical protein M3Y94_00158800 [Aphelenchoides besseyi]|nr:hypothetical protein M3Y94_00158800 [Aphelenchoides besseyi]KAI6237092.1 hypothetical protein M3Y95_00228700 [Aphelenchoides besseyi]
MGLPFVPSFVWFVFGSIATWTRLPAFEITRIESPTIEESNHIEFERLSSFNPLNLTNSLNSFKQQHNLALFTVCNRLGSTALSYRWRFEYENGSLIEEKFTENCAIRWQAPRQGVFVVKLTVKQRHSIVLQTQRTVHFLDFWLVAVGDSFASGEGTGEITACRPQWLSEKCHRSTKAWPFLVYKRLLELVRDKFAIHFTFLACTGAAVNDGTVSLLDQLDIVDSIRNERGKGPEVLMMSVGGNDMKFAEILSQLLSGSVVSRVRSQTRLQFVSKQLDRVAERLKGLNPSQVIYPTYWSWARNDRGELDGNCDEMHGMTKRGLSSAESYVLKPLNRLIEQKAKLYGWTAVPEVTDLFARNGICAQKSLIRGVAESISVQGDTGGSFHPTSKAHVQIADLIFSKLKFSEFLS